MEALSMANEELRRQNCNLRLEVAYATQEKARTDCARAA